MPELEILDALWERINRCSQRFRGGIGGPAASDMTMEYRADIHAGLLKFGVCLICWR